MLWFAIFGARITGVLTDMAEYSELASRITAALVRIGSGLDELDAGAASGDGGESVSLKEALEAERDANSQLEERVLAIKEKQEKVVGRLEAEVEALRDDADAAGREVAQLRDLNAQLRENNSALREANAQGVGNADLINASLGSQLAAVTARRDADRAELDAILADLKPLAEGKASA